VTALILHRIHFAFTNHLSLSVSPADDGSYAPHRGLKIARFWARIFAANFFFFPRVRLPRATREASVALGPSGLRVFGFRGPIDLRIPRFFIIMTNAWMQHSVAYRVLPNGLYDVTSSWGCSRILRVSFSTRTTCPQGFRVFVPLSFALCGWAQGSLSTHLKQDSSDR